MESERFDRLARSLGQTRSRRSLTRLLGGLSLGGILATMGGTDAAAGSRIGGAPCTSSTQCATGTCLPSGKCSCSRENRSCRQPRNKPCKKAVCDLATSQCELENRNDGISCPGDGNPCTDDTCMDGRCTHPNTTNGGTCTTCQASTCSCQDGTCALCLPHATPPTGLNCQTICCSGTCSAGGEMPGCPAGADVCCD